MLDYKKIVYMFLSDLSKNIIKIKKNYKQSRLFTFKMLSRDTKLRIYRVLIVLLL